MPISFAIQNYDKHEMFISCPVAYISGIIKVHLYFSTFLSAKCALDLKSILRNAKGQFSQVIDTITTDCLPKEGARVLTNMYDRNISGNIPDSVEKRLAYLRSKWNPGDILRTPWLDGPVTWLICTEKAAEPVKRTNVWIPEHLKARTFNWFGLKNTHHVVNGPVTILPTKAWSC